MNELTLKNFGKATLVGLLGSLIMLIFITIGLKTGMAPFKLPPSAAMLLKLGLPPKPLGLVVHFLYGASWAAIFLFLFKSKVNFKKGILLSIGLWIIMMVAMSPMIGWGFFGFAHAEIAKDSMLYLSPGPKYMIITLVLHLMYGSIIGLLTPKWALVKSKV